MAQETPILENEPINVEVDNSEVIKQLEQINEYIEKENKEMALEEKKLQEEEKVFQEELKKEAAIQEKVEKEEQEYKETQQETLDSISENLAILSETNEKQNEILSADPDDNLVYQVVLADEQLEKMKDQRDGYTDMVGVYLSAIIGLFIGYLAIKGLLNQWKS